MRWPSTAALRGALWITLIALIATGIALSVQYVQTVRLLDARAQAAVDDETAGLIERYQSEGPFAVCSKAGPAQSRLPRVVNTAARLLR